MAHKDEVARVMAENDFPMNKVEFSYSDKIYYNPKDKTFTEEPTDSLKGYKCCLLATNSDKSMDGLRSRVKKSQKTIFYIIDQAPQFYPAIIKNPEEVFDYVLAVFIPEPTNKL